MKAEADNPYFGLVDQQYMRWAATKNLMVNVWTVDDPAEAQRLTDIGITSIITNQPALIRSMLHT